MRRNLSGFFGHPGLPSFWPPPTQQEKTPAKPLEPLFFARQKRDAKRSEAGDSRFQTCETRSTPFNSPLNIKGEGFAVISRDSRPLQNLYDPVVFCAAKLTREAKRSRDSRFPTKANPDLVGPPLIPPWSSDASRVLRTLRKARGTRASAATLAGGAHPRSGERTLPWPICRRLSASSGGRGYHAAKRTELSNDGRQTFKSRPEGRCLATSAALGTLFSTYNQISLHSRKPGSRRGDASNNQNQRTAVPSSQLNAHNFLPFATPKGTPASKATLAGDAGASAVGTSIQRGTLFGINRLLQVTAAA